MPSAHVAQATAPLFRKRVRLLRTLRSAYLERAHRLPPATIIYRVRRYDFQESLLEGLEVVQAGPVRAAWLLACSRVSELEINEPLMLSSLPGSALAVASLRLRSLVGGPRVTIVSYAMENADPFSRAPGEAMRLKLRRVFDIALARFVWGQIDRVAFATDTARGTYGSALPAPRNRTVTALIPALPAPCSCEHDTERGVPRVLFVGALVERKGVRRVLESWASVRDQVPDARLCIIGKGGLEGRVRAAADRDDSIELMIDPDRSEIHRNLRRSGVLVLPSQPTPTWREQIGLPIVEGLAHGCAVVTTTETGLAGWLAGHGHGVLEPASSPSELADALVSALRAARSASAVTADLPATDGRLAADAWLFSAARREPGGQLVAAGVPRARPTRRLRGGGL